MSEGKNQQNTGNAGCALVILAVLVLAGYAGLPFNRDSQRPLPTGGNEPIPANYEQMVKDYLAGRLRDPHSAQVEFHKQPYWGEVWMETYEGAKVSKMQRMVSVATTALEIAVRSSREAESGMSSDSNEALGFVGGGSA